MLAQLPLLSAPAFHQINKENEQNILFQYQKILSIQNSLSNPFHQIQDQLIVLLLICQQYQSPQQNIIINMDKVGIHRYCINKQNDFKKGNAYKDPNPKLYQSVSMQLSPSFIKKQHVSNSTQFYQSYGQQILRQDSNLAIRKPFLSKHGIDAFLRAKMIDWMIEVTSTYKLTSKTFFDSVQLMDRYFQAEAQCLAPNNLHIIGVVCMFMASKMNEVLPLRINTVFEKIGHRKLTVSQLVQMQQKIMSRLGYKLTCNTYFDLAILKTSQYVSYLEQLTHSYYSIGNRQRGLQDKKTRMEELCSFICKHLIFQYEYICQNSMMLISQSIVKAVLQMMGIIPIPHSYYSTSAISLQIGKQKVYKLMKRFKTSYPNMTNIFKFTGEEVLAEVGKFQTH